MPADVTAQVSLNLRSPHSFLNRNVSWLPLVPPVSHPLPLEGPQAPHRRSSSHNRKPRAGAPPLGSAGGSEVCCVGFTADGSCGRMRSCSLLPGRVLTPGLLGGLQATPAPPPPAPSAFPSQTNVWISLDPVLIMSFGEPWRPRKALLGGVEGQKRFS